MKMTESFFSSNWLRCFFKASDLCQKQHFWKCKSSFTAHNEAPKTQKWKIVIFILKTVIFLELVKPLGASSSHFGLDLLFENRLRRPNGRLRRNISDKLPFPSESSLFCASIVSDLSGAASHFDVRGVERYTVQPPQSICTKNYFKYYITSHKYKNSKSQDPNLSSQMKW